jgi:hypothetical protein
MEVVSIELGLMLFFRARTAIVMEQAAVPFAMEEGARLSIIAPKNTP